MFEQTNNTENGENNAERVEALVLKEIDDAVRKRHSDKEYHAPEHSLTVDKNSAEILSTIEQHNPGTITEEMERARKTGARGHDIYIATAIDPKTGTMVRLRGLGADNMPENVASILKEQGKPLLGNEEVSAVEVIGVIAKHDPNQEVYTSDVNRMMIDTIRATYPIPSFVSFSEKVYSTTDAGENRVVVTDPDTQEQVDLTEYLYTSKDGKPVGLKMDQFINEDSELGTIAIAMGDLSQGGRFDSEVFRDEGNREFWESKPHLVSLANSDMEKLTADEKSLLAKEAIGWIEVQLGFLLHQKMRFESTLDTNQALNALPNAEATKTALRTLYGEWDRNLVATAERIRRVREKYAGLKDAAVFEEGKSDAKLKELLDEMSYGAVKRG